MSRCISKSAPTILTEIPLMTMRKSIFDVSCTITVFAGKRHYTLQLSSSLSLRSATREYRSSFQWPQAPLSAASTAIASQTSMYLYRIPSTTTDRHLIAIGFSLAALCIAATASSVTYSVMSLTRDGYSQSSGGCIQSETFHR